MTSWEDFCGFCKAGSGIVQWAEGGGGKSSAGRALCAGSLKLVFIRCYLKGEYEEIVLGPILINSDFIINLRQIIIEAKQKGKKQKTKDTKI